jgi:hypothetical protein
VDRAWWDGLVAVHPGATIFQAGCWADFLAEYLGRRPFFFVARDGDGNVLATLLGFVRGLWEDHVFERPGGRAIGPLLRRALPVASWRYGPLWHTPAPAPELMRECAAALVRGLQGRGVYAVEGAVSLAPPPSPPSGDPFERVLPGATVGATLLVDVTADPDLLWRALKPSARKAVQSARRHGVEVRRVTDLEELRAYRAFFLAHNVERAGRFYSFRRLERMWKHLHPCGAVEIFAARRRDELLAGLGVWRFGGTCIEFSARQSRACREARIYAPDLIRWEIIRWAHDQGLRWYDLAGVSPDPRDDKERGIRQFKEKWGGAYWELMAREGILSPWRHQLVEAIRRSVGLLRR